jgi:hypothetical protein
MVYRLDVPTASATPPVVGTVGTEGFPTAGEPGVTPPAIIDPYWAYALCEEIRNVVLGAGITPQKSLVNQLASAIQTNKLNFAVDSSSTVDIVTLTLAPAPVSPGNGFRFFAQIANTNVGDTTLVLNGVSYDVKQGGVSLSGGELQAVYIYEFVLDNTSALLIGSSAGPVNIGNGSKPNHAVALGQFEQKPLYDAGQTGSITPSANTNYTVATQTITFPTFSKTGAFRVRARLIVKGQSTAASVSQNFTASLIEGTNTYTGAAWLIYCQNTTQTFGTSDTFLTEGTYVPGSAHTFNFSLDVAGGSTAFSIAGCNMELFVEEA